MFKTFSIFVLAEVSDDSSDEEPLINLVKKPRAIKKPKTKAPTPKKKSTPSRSPRKKPGND